MTRFRTGLVVGKFCPLHRGHQVLLDRATEQCEQLVVISYTNPEFNGCAVERRDRWLAALYPDALRLVIDDARLLELCRALGIAPATLPRNDHPDDVHRAFVAWLLRAVLRLEVDVVFTSEGYGDGFASALSQSQHCRRVSHESVDPARTSVPVSGTALRAEVHRLRDCLHPTVYRDFVQRVAILGGESTGKSTLSAQLACHLDTVQVPEYGRELWEAKGGALTRDDLLHIARTQIQREDRLALEAKRYLICDTTPLTTRLYAEAMYDYSSSVLDVLASRPYDIVFLCSPDVPFVQDGTRRDERFRAWQHDWYERELTSRAVAYHLLEGDWDGRLASALTVLGGDTAA